MQDPTLEAPESALTSPSGDSKPVQQSAKPVSRQGSLPMGQTAPGPTLSAPAPAEPPLSQHPKAIASRLYRKRVRENKAGQKTHQSAKRPKTQKPLWSADDIRAKLRKWDRAPFLDLLGAWLECAPTPEALIAFADRFPDRYASSLLAISKIAGFAERKEVMAELHGHVTVSVEDMSDSQLEDHLRSLAYGLGIPVPKTIELTALPSPVESTEPPRDCG